MSHIFYEALNRIAARGEGRVVDGSFDEPHAAAAARSAIDAWRKSPAAPQCLITGCALVDGNRQVWGDLHAVGDCYVFNAVLFGGETAWQYNEPTPSTMKQVEVLGSSAIFERRGVLIFPQAAATLNPAAEAYLKGAPS
jgi:hypothetical protein